MSMHPESLAEGVDADGQDHELLHGERVARVAAAIDDVERRHREHLRSRRKQSNLRISHSSHPYSLERSA